MLLKSFFRLCERCGQKYIVIIYCTSSGSIFQGLHLGMSWTFKIIVVFLHIGERLFPNHIRLKNLLQELYDICFDMTVKQMKQIFRTATTLRNGWYIADSSPLWLIEYAFWWLMLQREKISLEGGKHYFDSFIAFKVIPPQNQYLWNSVSKE